MIRIGTAGWALPRTTRDQFGQGASNLERYATRFNCAEINSSFYRPHRPSTYARWAESVPGDFRFSAKIPKTITHDKRLKAVAREWKTFFSEISALDDKLGALLVQLPPSLIFEPKLVTAFAKRMRDSFNGQIAWEPRHASWFTPEANALLMRHRMARVAADPPRIESGAKPGGWTGFAYWRLHGSPRMYYSDYEPKFLNTLAKQLNPAKEAWVIFDNTTLGFATGNALQLKALV